MIGGFEPAVLGRACVEALCFGDGKLGALATVQAHQIRLGGSVWHTSHHEYACPPA